MAGRPSKYNPELNSKVYKHCLIGATNKDLAAFCEVDVRTIDDWIANNDDFSRSVKKGRVEADAKVVKSLFKRATGYKIKEQNIVMVGGKPIILETIKEFPPDTTACIYWTRNRRPKHWKQNPDENRETLILKEVQVVSASSYMEIHREVS
jgi:hypothetical protein